MPSIRSLKFAFLFLVAVLGAAGAFATIAPDTARAVLFPRTDWRSLSADERQILAPLAGRWDAMKYVERERWRALAAHYKEMPAQDQKRIQRRMQRWAAATPGQRHVARNAYKKFKDKPATEKRQAVAAWERYAAARGMPGAAGEAAAAPPTDPATESHRPAPDDAGGQPPPASAG